MVLECCWIAFLFVLRRALAPLTLHVLVPVMATNNLLKAAFCKVETGKWATLLILGQLPVNQ